MDHTALHRRRLLRALGTFTVASLAGCSGGTDSDATSTTGTSPTDTPTGTTAGTVPASETEPTETETETTSDASVDALKKRARELTLSLANGEYQQVHDSFVGEAANQITVAELEQAWVSQTSSKGSFTGISSAEHSTQDGFDVVVVETSFDSGVLLVRWVFDESGVAGLQLLPPQNAYSPPAYADQSTFEETTLSLSSPACDLGATLSMPTGDGQVPGVVLVHGSGPNDRDETIGPNKVFKDIAWGLASNGVAVLRYDKRTFACEGVSQTDQVTINDVTVDDALTAIERLAGETRVSSVAVVGHSLGAMMAPEIASRSDVAGAVLLAGPTRPLWELIPEQAQYLVRLDDTVTDAEQAQLDQITSAVERIGSGNFPGEEVLLGYSGTFWRSLKGYDQTDVARSIRVPLLLQQGGRDYQVPPASLDRWREVLTERDATFESYPSLNHLFMPGEGPSTPSEYFTPNNVDEAVVADIADWVAKR
jgi:dienelactone hydrolase